MKIIILAGGKGTRLWPLSNKETPKHLIPFIEDASLLAGTYRRALCITSAENILTITNEEQFSHVKREGLSVSPRLAENIICEPAGKSTAPAIALGFSYLKEFCGLKNDETLLVLPADHLITPDKGFAEIVSLAQKPAGEGFLVTFGIKPDLPKTGYGYIRQGEKRKGFYIADGFTEKPDTAAAKHYHETGLYYWNSGIFAFRTETLHQEMRKYSPGISIIMDLPYAQAAALFKSVPSISIDYALMEKSRQVAVVPVLPPIFWSDIGSWDSIYDILAKDLSGNAIKGDASAINSKDSLIYSSGRKLAVIGMEGVIVVETPDAVLVVKRGAEQKVREITEKPLK